MPLASNQIQYSLLYRVPESNGVVEACNEAGATVIAYSPLAQGLLTGECLARSGHLRLPHMYFCQVQQVPASFPLE